jgi:hypothetical protein
MPSHSYHIGYTCHAAWCAALGLTDSARRVEAEVTVADLLVLAPWLVFGAALAVICYRLLTRRGGSRRRRRNDR